MNHIHIISLDLFSRRWFLLFYSYSLGEFYGALSGRHNWRGGKISDKDT